MTKSNAYDDDLLSVGIDVGGTFTDVVVVGKESSRVFKIPSTPRDPGQAVVDGILRLRDEFGVDLARISRIVHGTTVATNAVLEGKGARTGLITNRGFEDVLEIGRQNRSSLPVPHPVYNLQLERPPQLVSRRYRCGVRGRLSFNGGELEPLDEDDVREAGSFLASEGVRSVAVCLLYSYADPSHERRVRDLLQSELGNLAGDGQDMYITLSSDILPEFREYERTTTTVISAMLKPVMHGYLSRLEDRLRSVGVRAPLEVMQSSGGIMRAETAGERAIYTLLSGPAAGVRGAQYAVTKASEVNGQNLITLDMGGTSTDLSLIASGQVTISVESAPGGYPVRIPMVDVNAIGQGGGSIVSVDAVGGVHVGPESAGAEPGPVCYGRGGTQPTVTDAQLVVGRLNANRPLAGQVALDPAAAQRAIKETVARPLGISADRAAQGIIDIVIANMKRAVQVISIEKGYDPRDFALVAFGGAGPLHAPLLAQEMNIPRVIVPTSSGVLSALGLLAVDLAEHSVQSFIRPLASVKADGLEGAFAQLEQRANQAFVAQGHDKKSLSHARFLDLRYMGQSYELIIPFATPGAPAADGGGEDWTAGVEQLFHAEHRRVYGHASPSEPIQLVNLRLVTSAPVEKPTPRLTVEGRPRVPRGSTRPVFIDDGWVDAPIYERGDLPVGFLLDGPAVIEEPVCTTFLPPGARLSVDAYGNLIIDTGVNNR